VWSATVRHAALVHPITVALQADPNTSFHFSNGAVDTVVAMRRDFRHDLATIRDGVARSIPNSPAPSWLGGIDARGERAWVARDRDAGILSLVDGSYRPLAGPAGWGVFDGDRVIETEGDHLAIVDAATGRLIRELAHPYALTAVRGGAVRCATAVPGRCVVVLLQNGGHHAFVAPLDGVALGTPIDLGGPAFDEGLGPDGRLAVVTGGIDVLELATGRRVPLLEASGDHIPRYVQWNAKGDAVYYAVDDGARVFRLAQTGGPQLLFSADNAWITGLAIEPDGTPLVGLRRWTFTGVVLDAR
jgi:hypothetical protein